MPKVYVVQQHLHKDAVGILVPKWDLSPAAQYGELVFCLKVDDKPSPDNFAPANAALLGRIREALADITEEDYILPIGSPLLMCLVAVVAAETCARLNFLYYHRKDNNYRVNTYDLE